MRLFIATVTDIYKNFFIGRNPIALAAVCAIAAYCIIGPLLSNCITPALFAIVGWGIIVPFVVYVIDKNPRRR